MNNKNKTLIILLIFYCFFFKTFSQEKKEIPQDWISVSQNIEILDKKDSEFKISVAIRKESKFKASKAAFWVRVHNKLNEKIFFKNNAMEIEVSDKWKRFEIISKIPDQASRIYFGAFAINSGDFYFDDFKIELKNDKGKWEEILIKDSGFEANDLASTNWKQGADKNKGISFENFEVSFSNNKPFKGEKSLLIKGRNILGSNDSGKYIDVNDVSLYYEEYGQGEPLLLIHGNGNSMSGFIGNVQELAKFYRVILVDCRGRGASTYKSGVELTFDLQIDDLIKFLDKIGVKKTHIVGWSDGGILGLLMAIQHPDRVDKLISMAANIFPEGCVDLEEMIATRDRFVKENVNHQNDLFIDLFNLDIKYPKLEYKDLNVIKSKTLIMAGDHDEIKNEHTVKIFEAIPNAQLAIVPNANHYLPKNNPSLFNEIVLRFLNESK